MAQPNNQLDVPDTGLNQDCITTTGSNAEWTTTKRTITNVGIVGSLTKLCGGTLRDDDDRTLIQSVRTSNGKASSYDGDGAETSSGFFERRDSVLAQWPSLAEEDVVAEPLAKKRKKHASMTAEQQETKNVQLAAALQRFDAPLASTEHSARVTWIDTLTDKQVLGLAYRGSLDEDVQARVKAIRDRKAEERAAQLAERRAARLAAKEQAAKLKADELSAKEQAAKLKADDFIAKWRATQEERAAALASKASAKQAKETKEDLKWQKRREAADRHYAFKAGAGALTPELEKVVSVLRNLSSKKDLKFVMDFAAEQLDKQEGVDNIIEELLRLERSWEEDNHEYVLMLTRFLERQGIVPIGALEM